MENCRNPYQPLTTLHLSASEKRQNKDSTQNSRKRMIRNIESIIALDGKLCGQQLQNEPVIIPRMTIPTGRKLMKGLPKIWLKNRRGKNVALIAPSKTTPGENVESRLWWQLPSLTGIGETLNLTKSHALLHWLCTTLPRQVLSKSLRLTEYIERCLPKCGNCPIQK